MKDKVWKIIYEILLILLREEGSFISHPNKIEIFVSDGVRRSLFERSFKDE